MTTDTTNLKPEQLDDVVIRFAGDSGDGMQLTGDRFTDVERGVRQRPRHAAQLSRPRSARPPARSPGVSSFQVHISDHEILTPGDVPDVLVAMNPAALKANIAELSPGGTLIVNADTFEEKQPRQGRLSGEPARGRLARRVQGHPGADDLDHHRGHQGARREAALTPSGPRTSSPSGSCRGCTPARSNRRSSGSSRSSRVERW